MILHIVAHLFFFSSQTKDLKKLLLKNKEISYFSIDLL